MPSSPSPYLSIVVTTRNDDHGGNALRRTQTFLNGLSAQCRRHDLQAELIIVEWNPPADRPPLVQALRWPEPHSSCEVRIIEVPQALHARFRHSKALGLYQMIAKNVGIRRARGEFVLATNIDILFSDELMDFIAGRGLDREKMYRMDRYDVMMDVPTDGSVEEQLAYCNSHLIRVNNRERTVRLGEDEFRLEPNDIAAPDSGISFQSGWYDLELEAGLPFRWVNNDADMRLRHGATSPSVLVLDLEPGPGVGFNSFLLEVQGMRLPVERRSLVRVPLTLSSSGPTHVRFHVEGGGQRIVSDVRTLNFRVFRCQIVEGRLQSPSVKPVRSVGAWVGRLLKFRCGPAEPALTEAAPPALDLHTNACGDFTLLAREHWMDLRGYPELDLFSMNIDSLFCCTAHFGGIREEMLKDPMRIFHIEHATGSGWTPEGQKQMFGRLEASGVPWLDYKTVVRWAGEMDHFKVPFIFNREDWGLAGEALKETLPLSS